VSPVNAASVVGWIGTVLLWSLFLTFHHKTLALPYRSPVFCCNRNPCPADPGLLRRALYGIGFFLTRSLVLNLPQLSLVAHTTPSLSPFLSLTPFSV